MSIGVERWDHVGLAVSDLAEASRFFVEVLGGELLCGGDFVPLNQRSVQFRIGPAFKVELLQPVGPGPLERFLDRHGPGVHHATLLVEDLPAAIGEMEGAGYRLRGTDLANPRWCQTFVGPEETSGCLFQIVASTLRWDVPVPGQTLEEIVRGEWIWGEDLRPHRRDPA